MQFTLFGYPKSGKTTLFNLLTGAGIETKAFDTGEKEPHLRSSPIPDERLDRLGELYPEKEKKSTTVDFVDLAGMAFGEVKESAYLSHLRKADGLAHVVRGFEDEQIPHPKGKVNIQEDIRSMEDELVLADTISGTSRLEKLEKELSRAKNPEGEKERDLLSRFLPDLENGQPLRELDLSPQDEKIIRSFAFLSLKPLLHLINLGEEAASDIDKPDRFASSPYRKTSLLAFCGKIESEIMELEEEEAKAFLEEYGLKELSSKNFLRTSFDLLDLITFYTIGENEVKAWSLPKNTAAVNAAGTIHTDMEKGFIKAEVISCDELLQHGSFHTAKEKAAVRLEGKDYLVQDGDVLYIRFSK
jgi:GTP-binding protein YchF